MAFADARQLLELCHNLRGLERARRDLLLNRDQCELERTQAAGLGMHLDLQMGHLLEPHLHVRDDQSPELRRPDELSMSLIEQVPPVPSETVIPGAHRGAYPRRASTTAYVAVR